MTPSAASGENACPNRRENGEKLSAHSEVAEKHKKYAKKLSFFYIFQSIPCCKDGKKIV